MDSARPTPCGVGCPIRTSADQRSLASPRGFSQRATSFIASWRQGIHRTPLACSTQRHHRPHAGPNRAPTEDTSAPTTAQQRFITETLALSPARPYRPAGHTPDPDSPFAKNTGPPRPARLTRPGQAGFPEASATTREPPPRAAQPQRRNLNPIARPPETRLAAPPLAQNGRRARLSGGTPCRRRRIFHRAVGAMENGGDRIRTDDPLLAKQALYQLSYAPAFFLRPWRRKNGPGRT